MVAPPAPSPDPDVERSIPLSNPRIPYRLRSGAGLPLLEGKRLIVQLIVNIEAWRFDQKMPRTIVSPPQGVEQIPDVPNFCWAEYGMRVGMVRLFDELGARGLPAGASINAGVIDLYPDCAAAARDAGWEFIGHGMFQRMIQGDADERGVIDASLAKIAAFTGTRPRGWLSPGLRQSLATPDILVDCGVEYTFDWPLDDVPNRMTTSSGRLVALPYAQDLNDSIIYAVERHATGEFQNRLKRSLASYDHDQGPRVISMGLHPHLIAVPHRMDELRAMLDLLQGRADTIFVTPAKTMDWFLTAAAENARVKIHA